MHRTLLWILVSAGLAFSQPSTPSRWEGRATGSVAGERFDVPITIELSPPLPHEANPFHLFLGTSSVTRVGDLLLMSATQMGTGGSYKVYRTGRYGVGVYDQTLARTTGDGNVTLQYMKVTPQGSSVTAVLTETQAAAAAAGNTFTGPNVSAQEASDLMRGVMEALGPTEIFALGRGATVRLDFGKDEVTGSVAGVGRSVLNTSSDVRYNCAIRARRVQ